MAKVGYVTLGTNDVAKAAGFYDALLGSIGHVRVFEDEYGFIAWGANPHDAMLAITPPFDRQPATVGNGVMVALRMDSTTEVDTLHAKALELGATDEGAPGKRIDSFYAAYFRDLEGNKLAAFFYG